MARLGVQIDDELRDDFKQICEMKGLKIKAAVSQIIREYVEQNRHKEAV